MEEEADGSLSSTKLMDGPKEDLLLSRSEHLTRKEILKRRVNYIKKLKGTYRDHYWVLIEDLKNQYREYFWEYGRSPFGEEDENDNHTNNNNDNINRNCAVGDGENGNMSMESGSVYGNTYSNKCEVHGCRSKAMALARFCHMHILSDSKQKLYKPCNYSIKSSTSGPILCGKPILRSTVPSYCPLHFQKAEKYLAKALKKAGLNVSSASKLAPKFHVIVADYVRQIQNTRRAAALANLDKVDERDDISI